MRNGRITYFFVFSSIVFLILAETPRSFANDYPNEKEVERMVEANWEKYREGMCAKYVYLSLAQEIDRRAISKSEFTAMVNVTVTPLANVDGNSGISRYCFGTYSLETRYLIKNHYSVTWTYNFQKWRSGWRVSSVNHVSTKATSKPKKASNKIVWYSMVKPIDKILYLRPKDQASKEFRLAMSIVPTSSKIDKCELDVTIYLLKEDMRGVQDIISSVQLKLPDDRPVSASIGGGTAFFICKRGVPSARLNDFVQIDCSAAKPC